MNDDLVQSPSILLADVTGFVELKTSTGNDYQFVIEVQWSDGTLRCVKRTYREFLRFRQLLVQMVEEGAFLPRNPIFIPKLNGIRFFRRYDRNLAEEREEELHIFVSGLLKDNPMLGWQPSVKEFFESRVCDPVPYRSPPDGDSFEMDVIEEDERTENVDVFNRTWVGK